MGTKYSTILVGGVVQTYNDNPPSDDGSQTEANRVKYATVTSDLTAPLHSAIITMNNQIVTHVNEGPTPKSGNYTTVAADHNSVIECTGSIVITLLTPVSNKGYRVTIKNAGTGVVDINVTGGNNVDGATTQPLHPGQGATYYVNDAETAYYSDKGYPGVVLMESDSISGVASKAWTLNADFYRYQLVFDDLQPVNSGQIPELLIDGDTGASDYAWGRQLLRTSSTSYSATVDQADDSIPLTVTDGIGTGGQLAMRGIIDVFAHGAARYTQVSWNCNYDRSSDNGLNRVDGWGQRLETAAHTSLTLRFPVGNINSMSYVLYGYRAS